MTTLSQFKLTNNEEIVCEIVEWPSDDMPDLVIKNGLKLIQQTDEEKGLNFYQFKPFMSFNQVGNGTLQQLNPNHIICQSKPDEHLIRHYSTVVHEIINSESDSIDMDDELESALDEIESGTVFH